MFIMRRPFGNGGKEDSDKFWPFSFIYRFAMICWSFKKIHCYTSKVAANKDKI